MAALTGPRTPRADSIQNVSLPLAAQTVWKGGCAAYDTAALGSVKKMAATATLVAIGVFEESVVNGGAAGSINVLVRLQHEIDVTWFENAGNITLAANLFGLAYFVDDHTVSATVGTNAVAGRIWDVDSLKGVAVEFVGNAPVL
jgi:hypothetical protein